MVRNADINMKYLAHLVALDQVEYEHPVVKEVVEIFNGSITDIRT